MHFGYWDDRTRSHRDSLINSNRVMATRASLQRGHSVLDAGCGVGGTAMWLAQNYGVRVAGITLVHDQAARAGRWAKERGLDRVVTVTIQDYSQTAFPEGTFDAVLAMESSCHTPDKRAFLGEAFRVLRPGGRLVVEDGFRAARPYSDQEQRLQLSWLSGFLVPPLPTSEEFAATAREVGFHEVEVENATANYRQSCRRLYRIAMCVYPGAAALHALGLRSDVQHGHVRAARDQWRGLKRGLWVFAIVTARKPS
ncbi:MAG: SAM-dependent methyltransferase [Actinomycetota bacterium]